MKVGHLILLAYIDMSDQVKHILLDHLRINNILYCPVQAFRKIRSRCLLIYSISFLAVVSAQLDQMVGLMFANSSFLVLVHIGMG